MHLGGFVIRAMYVGGWEPKIATLIWMLPQFIAFYRLQLFIGGKYLLKYYRHPILIELSMEKQ